MFSKIRGDRWEHGISQGGSPGYLGQVEKSILNNKESRWHGLCENNRNDTSSNGTTR